MLSATEYEEHRETIRQRDEITRVLRNVDATHVTLRPVWHGYEYPAGTLLVAAPELHAVLDKGKSEIRDGHGCTHHWYVHDTGNVLNLWACEIDEYEYPCCDATLPDGIEIVSARFTGGTLAVCRKCEDYRAAYWECACELVHECTDDAGDE